MKEINLQAIERLEQNDLTALTALLHTYPHVLQESFDKEGNCSGRHCEGLLVRAVRNKNAEAVHTLLKLGACPIRSQTCHRVSLFPWLSSSPLGVAIYHQHEAITETLFQHVGNFEGVYPQIDYWMFSRAISEQHLDFIKFLLRCGFDFKRYETVHNISFIAYVLDELDSRGKTAIDFALFFFDLGLSITVESADNPSPLESALKWLPQTQLIDRLLDMGADPAILDREGYPILERLCQYDDLPDETRLGLLGETHNFNAASLSGKTPLICAVKHHCDSYIRFLAKMGADLNAQDNNRRDSPLITAIKCDAKPSLIALIELGATLNDVNEQGLTALDLIMKKKKGNETLIAKMRSAGAHTAAELVSPDNPLQKALVSVRNCIDLGEPWADAAHQDLQTYTDSQLTGWHTLVRHCIDTKRTKPSKQWLTIAGQLSETIGDDALQASLLSWFPLLKENRTRFEDHDEEEVTEYYEAFGDTDAAYYLGTHTFSENNISLLKGLIWSASRYDTADMSRTLRQVAQAMYKKVWGIGMRNAKLGNAALHALSLMSDDTGVKEIAILRATIKYNPALVNINRIFDRIATERGVSADELAQTAVPDYGLTQLGTYHHPLGDYAARITLTHIGKTDLVWVTPTGKQQKSVPAAVKRAFPDDVKALKALAKDLQVATRAHSQAIEQFYLNHQQLPLTTWLSRYIEHPVLGFIGRRLIWRFQIENAPPLHLMYHAGRYVNCQGTAHDLPTSSTVEIWHPVHSDVDEIESWRDFLFDHQITQPFKQAHREIYLLTDAERKTHNHSLRFAAHIIKQHQFHALATQRGWSQLRGGRWDGGNETSATKALSAFGLIAEFSTEGIEEIGGDSMYDCLRTHEVRFFKSNGKQQKSLALKFVEPLLFSEIMRDIDLFVGVTSIVNDPTWTPGYHDQTDPGLAAYWHAQNMRELSQMAQTRKAVLERMVPNLKIADRATIDGGYLRVKGKLRTYKIHLGSASILMEPNDQYLCIVPASSKTTLLFIPFEQDTQLTIILSKAFLLADDDKIKDPSIVSQIKRGNSLEPDVRPFTPR